VSQAPEGLLLVDKPEGPTSHDVVAAVRRALGQPRAGHTGTLDPAASGLLPLALGRATRLVRFLPHAPKRYEGTLRLGVTTSTDDAQGEPLALHGGPLPPTEAVLEAAAGLRGRILQTPPAISARKVGGERLYRLARRGHPVQAPPAEVEVLAFDLWPLDEPGLWGFDAEVSAGTYIRAMARDLGATLGCGGRLERLRRTRIGPLEVRDAVSPAPLDHPDRGRLLAAVIPLDAVPLAVVPAAADGEGAEAFVAGRAIRPLPGVLPDEGYCVVRGPGGHLLGVGELEGGWVRPRVVLRS
jgi:tRNA pseudouridine55 synthase